MGTQTYLDALIDHSSRGPDRASKTMQFQEAKRCLFDSNRRIPNVLSSLSGEGQDPGSTINSPERASHLNTPMDLPGMPKTALRQPFRKGLVGRASHNSKRIRIATSQSFIGCDPRYDLLHSAYAEGIGPGSYDIAGGLPGVGPLPSHSPTRGSIPARDPCRPHRAFLSPLRRELQASCGEAHHLGSYISPNAKGLTSKSTEWYKSSYQRVAVADYRYAARHSEARKEVPASNEEDDPRVDCSGRPLHAVTQTSRAAPVPFNSKLPRFVAPLKEQPAAPKPFTQRHYHSAPTHSNVRYKGLHPLDAAASPLLHKLLSHKHKGHGSAAVGRMSLSGNPRPLGTTSAFTTINRSQKFGPRTVDTDSSLM